MRPGRIAPLLLAAACGGRMSAPPASPPDVVVLVRGEFRARPVAAVQVAVRSAGGPWVVAPTGADGRARFAAVPRPYDLAVVSGTASKDADVFLGVTRADPVVLVRAEPAGGRVGRVEGSFPADCGGEPCPAISEGNGFVACIAPEVLGWSPFFPSDPAAVSVEWQDGATLAADVHALWWKGGIGNAPLLRYWHASRSVAVPSGGTVTVPAATMDPAATATLEVRTSGVPAWQVEVEFAFDPAPGGVRALTASSLALDLSTLSFPVPAHPAFHANLRAYSGSMSHAAWRRNVRGGGAPVELALRAPPDLLAPADGAGALSSTFAWVPVAGVPSVLAFTSVGLNVNVHTGGDSATYPDLVALGVSPPSAIQVTWTVGAKGPAASVDDLLAAPGGLQDDGWGSFASSRAFDVP